MSSSRALKNTPVRSPKRGKDVDMTQGNISRHIIMFALPLLAGNIFQQMYNMVDTWVVGRYVSNEAYAAAGTVGPVVNMLVGFFMGLSSGAGVVISQNYGAKLHGEVERAVHTAIAMTLILGVVFTGVGLAMTPFMLRLMKTPANVLPQSTTYLSIYFSGIMGLMVYNMGSGILRAVGDSQRPFYFLVVCAVMNTVLDLVFVLALDMGVAGVALATILSQAISALLVIVTLMRTDECIKFRFRKLWLHMDILKRIIWVGIPAAIQMTITSFSNIFVQSYVNQFGDNCMSGWTTYNKVDMVMLLPMQSLALASTTFVGQNLGSGQPERARKGINRALLLGVSTTTMLMIPMVLFAPYIVRFFNDKPEVVEYGTMLIRYISPFIPVCCLNQIYSGALRGAGNSKVPMIIMLLSFVAFRQAYMFVMSNICNEIIPIAMGYPAGWLLCSAITTIYFHTHKESFGRNRLVVEEKT